ncbi:MAG: RNA 2',3'-cyclic phosphodiesterase [Bacteroidales bacterium]|nr:RNA 2',3'-cyclic phosphodiesterase [Bacteroidales bacterium]MCF8387890.1 RNA 2',3'-cyclic phosphodiesterase [Bacteroidales bacterium]MCF8399427.1 RNA 2',3'-cyclic phosphodiesterase [Bacteroidales bacterium]
MKRLFAAIKLHPTDKFLELFGQLQNQLKQDKIKWVDPQKIHITLKFFGDTTEENIDEIAGAMDDAVFDASPFELQMHNVGIFGSSYKPRVIWFGIEASEKLRSLYQNLKVNLEELGYKYDRQNFVPHLTVGRIRHIQNKRYFQQVINRFKDEDIQKEKIDRLILFESILRPQGPEYIVVEEFTFQ